MLPNSSVISDCDDRLGCMTVLGIISNEKIDEMRYQKNPLFLCGFGGTVHWTLKLSYSKLCHQTIPVSQ